MYRIPFEKHRSETGHPIGPQLPHPRLEQLRTPYLPLVSLGQGSPLPQRS